MGQIAIYQANASRDIRQDVVKLALEALGLSVDDGHDVVQHGAMVYGQRDYNDFASITGSVKLTFTIGELKEGVTKEQPPSRARGVQEKEADASDSESKDKEE